MVILVSLILALVPLLGIVWVLLSHTITTVDGLFMSLILLSISGILGTSALFEVRRRMSGVVPVRASGSRQGAIFTTSAGSVRRGRVERVEFYESYVGQPNKSIVTLSDGSAQMLVLEGDMRNALPTGQKVEITFRKASGHNVLVNVNYP